MKGGSGGENLPTKSGGIQIYIYIYRTMREFIVLCFCNKEDEREILGSR